MNKRVFYLVLVLVFVVNIFIFSFFGFTAGEDGFISYRYARNFSSGYGVVFNPGEKVEGYTNPLWIALLAGGIKIGQDPVILSQVLSGFCLLTILFLISARWPQARMGALLLAANADLAINVLNGVETFAFNLALVGGAILLLKKSKWSMPPFFLAWVLRTDGFAYIGIAMFAVGLFWVLSGEPIPQVSKFIGAIGTGIVALYAPVLTWRWWYYGYPLPNTYYAKTVIPVSWNLGFGLEYLGQFLMNYPLWLVAIFTAVIVLRPSRLIRAILAFGLLNLLYIVYIGGDTHSKGVRFFIPLLLVGFIVPFAMENRSKWRIAVAVLLTAQILLIGATRIREQVDFTRKSAAVGFPAIGQALARNLPKGTVLAVEPVGQIGYYAKDLIVFDLLGLTNEGVAHGRDFGDRERGKGHVKVGYELALNHQVDCFWFQQLVRPGERLTLKPSYSDEPIRRLGASEKFNQNYSPNLLPVKNDLAMVLLCRNDFLAR